MIHIDPRSGSGELLPLFLSHRLSPPTRLSPLPAADFCFSFSGPKGPSLLGIERKTISDLLKSIRSQRLQGEQIPKLLDQYESHVWLLIEGLYRVNIQTGMLERMRMGEGGKFYWAEMLLGKHPVHATEMQGALATIATKTPIKIWQTRTKDETVDWVVAMERWGQTPWDKHHAHEGIHVPQPHLTAGSRKASMVRRTAYAWPGIGWERSGAVEARFRTVEEMVLAKVEDWAKVPGIGEVLARKTYGRIRGEFLEQERE